MVLEEALANHGSVHHRQFENTSEIIFLFSFSDPPWKSPNGQYQQQLLGQDWTRTGTKIVHYTMLSQLDLIPIYQLFSLIKWDMIQLYSNALKPVTFQKSMAKDNSILLKIIEAGFRATYYKKSRINLKWKKTSFITTSKIRNPV